MIKLTKLLSSFLILLFLSLLLGKTFVINAQSVSDLQKQIQDYQAQIATLSAQSTTLSNQIAQFDAKIKLTSLKIQSTEEQIALLGGRIDQLEGSLNGLTQAFSSRAAETYKMSRLGDQFFLLISSSSIDEAVSRYHYLKQIESSDQDLLQRLQTAQNIYQDQKASQEDLQNQLQSEKTDLDKQKSAKANLLAVTQNNEKKYQQLLAQAQAQLAALSNFSSSHGGGTISHQDLSDSWGKYYNQRDENWGGNEIGLSNYSVLEVGCLITSYAMVSTHFGGSITPANVAADTSNFFSNTAEFNIPGPTANGHSAQYMTNPSISDLKNALNGGAVIIAGLSANGGPFPTHYSDHWVVLRSVDGDTFKINDPWYQGAMNVSLSDHYSTWKIIEARIYH